ncbi:MAG TPA: hypothetical protein VE890_16845 [Thermoguttaceae bacterium]|nr:hypothetical protein [Thermoguttaceae bacterium]
MNDSMVIVRFDGNGRAYRPGETLAGEYAFDSTVSEDVAAVEVSVMWYSEGKGDEDLAVHEFSRQDVEEGEWFDTRRPGRFSTVLPNSPLSYEGVIVKLRWCVRVRVFLRSGGELVGEREFRLGTVPPAGRGGNSIV